MKRENVARAKAISEDLDNKERRLQQLNSCKKITARVITQDDFCSFEFAADEHQELLAHGWKMKSWKANGGYANKGNGRGRVNCKREALFMSPHCIVAEPDLFENI